MYKQNNITALFTVVITAFALYSFNPFALYFQNDDFVHIPLSAQGFLLQHNSFRPLCDISIMLDYFLYGSNAWGYHLTNLLLHILASGVLFFLQKAVLKKYFTSVSHFNYYSFFTALLFFIYSSHSEAVFWILGRSAILGAVFSMLFMYGYLKKNDSKKYTTLYVTALLLALLSYESSWALPVFCLLLCFIENENGRWKHTALVFIIFILYLLARFSFIHEVAGEYEAAAFLHADIFMLFKNYLLLNARSFLPAFNTNQFLFYCCCFQLVIWLLFFLRCSVIKKRRIIFLFVFFLLSLIPYASIGVDTNGTEGERFLYLPTAIVCMLFIIIIVYAKISILYKQIFAVAFCLLHIIVLYKNTSNYRFAGCITKTVITEIKNLRNAKTIYARDVPQSQFGALIFRQGLPEAVKWLAPETGIDTVIICTKRSEISPLADSYVVKYNNSNAMNCNNEDVKDAALLKFTDSVLYVNRNMK